ncbi:MAG TPA: glycosyltransferase family 39 protein [Xanthobacteraceae bacterium]|nr:glycosyltransferase family 39 protein [Xanthobacteraceae bacterium]
MTQPASPAIDDVLTSPQPRREAGTGSYLAATIVILAVLTIVRIIGLRFSMTDLFYDEAQYWSWSRELALGYYTKPPLLAWVIAAARHVCGDAEWCVRAPSPLFYAATSLLTYAIGRRLYDERAGFWAALLTALATGAVFSARIISTDVPLLFFWSLALLAYVNLLDAPSRRWAVVLGASIGLGMLAKYAMIYFLPGVALAALFSKRARRMLVRSDVWLALLVAVVVLAPNIIWNASNGFATVEHTGDLVLGEPTHLSIMRTLQFLAGQFGVFGPIEFTLMIYALVRLGSPATAEQDRILVAFFIPALAVVAGFAFVAKANDNWAAVSFVSGVVLTAALLARWQAKWWMAATVAFGLVVQVALIGADAVADRLSTASFHNPYKRTIGMRQYADAVGAVARKVGAKTIVTDSRADFSDLEYYWRDRPEQVLWWRRIEVPSFSLKEALTQNSAEPVLFINGCDRLDAVRKVYAVAQPLGRFTVPIGSVATNGERDFYAFLLSGARGPIPPFSGC